MANEQSTGSAPERARASIDKGTAEPGEIVVFIDGQTETPGILEFAGTLAQEHGARLISVFMQPELDYFRIANAGANATSVFPC